MGAHASNWLARPSGEFVEKEVAVVAASLIAVLGFLVALRLKDVKPSWASGNWKPNEVTSALDQDANTVELKDSKDFSGVE